MSAAGAATPGDKPTIEVLYTCSGCGIQERTVQVRERAIGEPVENWMRALAIAISADHRSASPRCDADAMDHVKIPTPPGTTAIGRAVRN